MLVLIKVYEQLERGRKRCLVVDTETEKTFRMKYHLYVWISNNGPIPEGWVIHHIDFNKLNDDISNLKMMTREEHDRLHLQLRWQSQDFADKMSKNTKQLWQDEEYRIKTIRRGWHHTEESKRKSSEKQKGRIIPEEQKEKISCASKKLWQDEEYRNKQMAVRKQAAEKVRGQKRTEEQKERMRLAALKRYGKI